MAFVCVRQQDESDCGAAVLATIARHHGRAFPVQRLRELAGTDRRGSTLLGVVEAARRLGFEARGVKGTLEALRAAPLPLIAHVRTEQGDGHFVVVHAFSRSSVTVADPAAGVRRWAADEFRARWSGHAVLLVPGPDPAEIPTAQSGGARFVRLLRGHAGRLGEAIVCAALVTGLGLASSLYVQQLVDSILLHQEASLLDLVGIGMALVLVFRLAFGALRHYLVAHLARKVDLSLVRAYLSHVLRMPMSFFETRRVGEVLSRIGDASSVRAALGGATVSVALDGVMAAGAVTAMFLTSRELIAVAAPFVPLYAAAMLLHVPALRAARRRMMEEGADVNARFVEDVTGVETVKAFGLEESRLAASESALVRLVNRVFSGEFLSLGLNASTQLLSGGASLAVLWYGGRLVMAGELTVGQLMFFSSLLGYLVGPLERLGGVVMQVQDALVALERLGEVMDLPCEGNGAGKARFTSIARGIRLERVSFRYGGREEVLKGITLEIPAGQTVAIVGESGSGKSTLARLLVGFQTPTSGSLTFDGIDVRDLDLSTLRGRIGWVSQEPFVFRGSIRENLALARPGATLQEVAEAARRAQLAEFVEGLPERWDTPLGERGANLSGGQRQRLAIARALVAQPELLVFDEATSHLDTRTERALQAGLAEALAGRTAVVIAHRLSTIRHADRIVVLDRGAVAEEGTHEELMALGGRYARLWAEQVGTMRQTRNTERSVA